MEGIQAPITSRDILNWLNNVAQPWLKALLKSRAKTPE